MGDAEYFDNPKDLKEMSFNIKLLIQKFNHEHSNSVEAIEDTKKDVKLLQRDLGIIKTGFIQFSSNIKAMNLMLKILFGIITAISTIVGIGAAVSKFN